MVDAHSSMAEFVRPLFVAIDTLHETIVNNHMVHNWELFLLCKGCNFQTLSPPRMSAHVMAKHVHKVLKCTHVQ